MKMKKYILSLALAFIAININSQTSTEIIPTPNDSRVITTGVPFLLIASDARAASMGDMGVATSVDTYSQFWNPSKYVFSETKSGFGLSYTPYLSKLVNDISLGNLTYFNRINERSAFAVSLRYFSLGEIEIIQDSKKLQGKITNIKNRSSKLSKFERNKEKLFASNVSHVGILVTPLPKTSTEFIDKWILKSRLSNIIPFIINNKIDTKSDQSYDQKLDIYKSINIETINCSAKYEQNLDQLISFIRIKAFFL